MKHFCTFVLIIATGYAAHAQQPAQYSLYMFNPLAWNPGYAGLEDELSATGVFRKQWTNLQGSPTTQNLSVHGPVYLLGGGLGFNVENDELGAQRLLSATVSYAYHLPVGSSGKLSLGISGGLVQRTLDGSKIRTPDGDYDEPGNFIHNDNLLPLSAESAAAPTFHAGVYFVNDWLEAGFSARNLTEPVSSYNVQDRTLNLPFYRSLNFNVGVHFDVSDMLSVHPYALVRSDLKQTQTDISVLLRYNDNIFGGASLRGYNSNSLDAVAILAGFKLSERLTLAYGYDLALSDISTVSNGSHEISLNYRLPVGKGRPPKIIYNPRSL